MQIKMTRTMSMIYDFDPEFYPEGTTPEEAIKIDCKNIDAWDDIFSCELIEDCVESQLIDKNNNVISKYKYSGFENTNE